MHSVHDVIAGVGRVHNRAGDRQARAELHFLRPGNDAGIVEF